jgi:Tol biopolymer transport system component
VTFSQAGEFHPAWSPSGNEIVYSSAGREARHLRRTSADGTAEPKDLTEGGINLSTPDWSPDGRYLMFKDGGPSEESLYYLDLSAQTASFDRTPYLTGPGNSSVPKFSPDGRFVAFVSDQSGRNEIYIQPFPGASGRMQASVSGGTQPRWRSDGRELFYVEESALMAISVSANGQALALGRPQQLFESPELASVNTWPTYDVSADGQRFLTASVTAEEEAAPPTIRIVQNWLEEFRNRER